MPQPLKLLHANNKTRFLWRSIEKESRITATSNKKNALAVLREHSLANEAKERSPSDDGEAKFLAGTCPLWHPSRADRTNVERSCRKMRLKWLERRSLASIVSQIMN